MKIMELGSAVTHQSKVIEKEKEEAKDRENRLCMKVRDLEKSLSSLGKCIEIFLATHERGTREFQTDRYPQPDKQ